MGHLLKTAIDKFALFKKYIYSIYNHLEFNNKMVRVAKVILYNHQDIYGYTCLLDIFPTLLSLLLLLFRWSQFIPSRNLIKVFTYNHMALMSLRSRSHVNASMV